MDELAATNAAAKRIRDDAAYLAERLVEASANKAKLAEAQRLRQEAEQKLAVETKKREDAEKKLRETEDNNRRLQAEAEQKLAAEAKKREDAEQKLRETENHNRVLRSEVSKLVAELKLKAENLTAVLSPHTTTTNGPSAKKQRLSVEQRPAASTTATSSTSQPASVASSESTDLVPKEEEHQPMDLDQLVRDSLVMCRRTDGVYYTARILDISGGPGQRVFKLHYLGWGSLHDEVIRETAAVGRFREHTHGNQQNHH